MAPRPALEGTAQLRWQTLADGGGQGLLFDRVRHEIGRGEFRGMEFLEVDAKRILNEVKSPGFLPFRWTVNPYRGCSHACSYCMSRPTHAYLGLDPGQDFDQRIVVKTNAVERLRAELHPSRWRGERIAMGTNTDPYQRAEGKYRLTRGLVGTLLEANNPFSILTKSTLILRDADLLGAAARRGLAQVSLSIGTVDEDVWRLTEPGTPPPSRRLRAVEQLNAAGIPTGVLVGPILPGLSDSTEHLRAVAKAVVEAGATHVSHIVLHLRSPESREVYLDRLGAVRPEVAAATDRMYRAANAPKADRIRIATELRAALEAAGGRLGAESDDPLPAPVDLAARRRRTEPDDDQLTLAL